MSETTPILAICDQCFHVHPVGELVQLDGEPVMTCPQCRGAMAPIPTPLRSELARLYGIVGAARAWFAAHQAEEAVRADSPYRRDRLLPPGEPGIALVRLAELLADA
jgi:hypothetical protein